MSQLLQLRQAVIDRIKAVLPTFTVEGHLGRFNAAELTRFLIAAPAVRVAVLGMADGQRTSDEDGTELDCIVRLAIYVVTKDDARKLSRDEACIAAVEAITLAAVGQRWGLDFCDPAQPASAQNLYSAETLAKGNALWAIEIGQPVRLRVPIGEGDVDELRQLFIGLAPEVGPEHIDDYIGPLPQTDLAGADNG
ncbi:MAG: hypothetical protein DCF29_09585 [Alphaproteobacteria bacterium]|nr:MAG: hypothetical protein DCF29_09585 [Alphaproteobacteria bacterium]